MATQLLDIRDIQSYLSNADSEDEQLLELLERQSIGELERRWDRTLVRNASQVRVVDGSGKLSLIMPEPIVSGTATIRTRLGPQGTYQSETEFEQRQRDEWKTTELIKTDGVPWPRHRASVEVTFAAGYQQSDVRHGGSHLWLRDALLRHIGSTYARRVQNAGAFSEEDETAPGEVSSALDAMISAHRLAMLVQSQPSWIR